MFECLSKDVRGTANEISVELKKGDKKNYEAKWLHQGILPKT